MNDIYKLMESCIERIHDELLLFTVFIILVSVSFPENKIPFFLIYIIAVVLYSIVTCLKINKEKDSSRLLDNFRKLLKEKTNWEKRNIDGADIFFNQSNNHYRIERSDKTDRIWTTIESWMEEFPNPTISENKVYLKYGESKLAEFIFLSCDGGRYFIPLPEKRCIKKDGDSRCITFEYSWKKESMEYNIGEIIGYFYRENDLAGVADLCKIKIE